ncbi:uncharacterized protein CLUP02_12377 [Colletotrichum lupini]|uniref:Uncharacterized protein n=1 Tax=Colletotrichum lupini TaxID=145971 RepID=A0A9Q8T159_9PEZI|nr:uncharacterized protein CLUP02_12377 [Colletotrichum lupini]UQC86875.1 hypothetical protein CLUP02_12377 [Colletotrichum lupini]
MEDHVPPRLSGLGDEPPTIIQAVWMREFEQEASSRLCVLVVIVKLKEIFLCVGARVIMNNMEDRSFEKETSMWQQRRPKRERLVVGPWILLVKEPESRKSCLIPTTKIFCQSRDHRSGIIIALFQR